MKKYLFVGAFLLMTATSFASKPADEHLKGYIEDSMCAKSGTAMMGGSREKCVAKCIKGGAKAVLVVGKKIYQISNQKEAIKYAGKDVVVDAKVTGDSIEITKISAS